MRQTQDLIRFSRAEEQSGGKSSHLHFHSHQFFGHCYQRACNCFIAVSSDALTSCDYIAICNPVSVIDTWMLLIRPLLGSCRISWCCIQAEFFAPSESSNALKTTRLRERERKRETPATKEQLLLPSLSCFFWGGGWWGFTLTNWFISWGDKHLSLSLSFPPFAAIWRGDSFERSSLKRVCTEKSQRYRVRSKQQRRRLTIRHGSSLFCIDTKKENKRKKERKENSHRSAAGFDGVLQVLCIRTFEEYCIYF